ncbi:MAG TPA: hypothetical protein VFE09_03925 [Rubrobacteraceae bacterium]|nr:hypothetical protein [Rubrobacteraceae bacterium]
MSEDTRRQARAWLRDAGGHFHAAHLVGTNLFGEGHEPPARDNLLCVGQNPPYNARLKELREGPPPLLAAFQAKDVPFALAQSAGGDWQAVNYAPDEFLAVVDSLLADREISGVALMFTRGGGPGSALSERFGALPVSTDDLRRVVQGGE